MPSELYFKRIKFTQGVAALLQYINAQGYTVALGPDGLKHMPHSLHYSGLAVDLNIYKNGLYLTKTEDYTFAGEFWKNLDPDFRWGGDFTKADGNHFSCTYGGRS